MLMDNIASALAVGAGLALPWVALAPCEACGHLTRRTRAPAHRCPSRRYTILRAVWVGGVLLGALARIAWPGPGVSDR
jgi:hypothetical protein